MFCYFNRPKHIIQKLNHSPSNIPSKSFVKITILFLHNACLAFPNASSRGLHNNKIRTISSAILTMDGRIFLCYPTPKGRAQEWAWNTSRTDSN